MIYLLMAFYLWRRMMEQRHRMIEDEKTSQGYVRYHCPVCGRRIAKRYPDPARGIEEDTIIVARGNPYALHSGGGSNIDGLEMEFGAPEEKPDDEALLAPWRAYLDTLED